MKDSLGSEPLYDDEEHRDRCALLRDMVEDLMLVMGDSCRELLPAIDAYEREPKLLLELEQLRRQLAKAQSGQSNRVE